MKKINYLTLAACILSLSSFSQTSGNLTGNFKGVESNAVVINYAPIGTRDYKTDTIKLVDNRLNYTLPGKSGLMIVISEVPIKSDKAGRMDAINIYRFPKEKLYIDADYTHAGIEYTVSGSPLYDELKRTEKYYKHFENKIKEIFNKLNVMRSQGVKDSLLRIEANKAAPMFDSLNAYKARYIRKHPKSVLSGYYFGSIPKDSVGALYKVISTEVKNGPFKGIIDKSMEAYEKIKIIKKAKEHIVPGKQAPDFTLMDIKGKPFKLSSLYNKDKYIVLDFWGVWCGWCIKGFPEMKEYYEKYKSKVEFIGIDCNDTEDKWKKGVADHKLPWINVRNTKENDITGKYAIEGFPTKMIISPTGKIEKVVIGESPEFYEKLNELLN